MSYKLVFATLALLATGHAAAQSPSPPPPPPPLSAYGELPDIEDVALSHSGTKVAYVARKDGGRNLIVTDESQKIIYNSKAGDEKFRSISWAGDDLIYYTLTTTANLGPGFTTDKHEFTVTAVVNLAEKGSVNAVFRRNLDLMKATFGNYGARLVDGKWTGYFGAIKFRRDANGAYVFDHGRPFLYAVDLQTMTSKQAAVAASEGRDREWLVDSTGNIGAMMDMSFENGDWRLQGEKGVVLARGKDITGDYGLMAFGPGGKSVIYFSENDASGEVEWYEVPIAGGEAKPFLKDVSVKRSYIDPRSDQYIGYLEDTANAKPVMFDPSHQKIMASIFKAFSNVEMRVAEWTPDFSHVLLHTSGTGDSGTWYLVNRSAKTATPIAYDHMDIAPEQVGPISMVKYRAGDGLEMEGVLTLPPGREAKNLPIIVLPHGGPRSYDTPEFDWWAQAFASRGYAVFQPNFRGSTGYGDAFRRAGYGEWGRKMQTDISDGLAELVRRGIADPKRACIMGASYGGYAALAGVTLQKGLYRCAVSVAGVSDLKDMRRTDVAESAGSKMTRASLDEMLGDPKLLSAVSPRNYANMADAPILLIHGKDDTIVPYNQSTQMASALKSAGKPYEFVDLKDEDHWLSRSPTRLQMLETAMAFVQKHNPAN